MLRHSTGEWAGDNFHLQPWQFFVVWNLFGWKRKDGTRRFRKAYMSLGRKNGKSTFCAGLAIKLGVADLESGAQIFIGATKLDQAKIIFDEAESMIRQSPAIAKHAKIHKANISFKFSNSFIRPLGSDKPFDGLNPHGVFFDELHRWQEYHRSFYDTMVTGSGARTQPLHVMITTAGSSTSYLYTEEDDYARGVLAGDVKDERLFAIIYELDDGEDPLADDFEIGTFVKANPGFGINVKIDEIQELMDEARHKPSARYQLMRYRANRRMSNVERVVDAETWDECKGPLSDWRSSDGIAAGVDLGGRDDLAAYGLCAKFETGIGEDSRPIYRYEGKSKAFIASDTKRDLRSEPFRTWIDEGKLIVCDYVIDTLKQYLIEDCQSLGVQYVAYDPYQAIQLADELEMEGLAPVKMPQNHGHFNETLTGYLAEIAEGRFKPDERDSVLRWCALNMEMNRNSKDQVMPDKKNSKEKIDAIVAYLMARRAVNHTIPPTRGSLIL